MDNAKRTEWTNYLNRRAKALWLEYCEIFPRLVKFDCPEISLNARLKKTAGRNFVEENKIELAVCFLETKANAENVVNVILPHEMAHQIDFNLNGQPVGNRWHGKNWQIIMIKIGQEPNTYHSMVA